MDVITAIKERRAYRSLGPFEVSEELIRELALAQRMISWGISLKL